MSREPSMQSEDDLVWNANDVEKSLLDNKMHGPQKDDNSSRWTRLKGGAVYLIVSFCFGALLSLAIIPQDQSRPECGNLPSQKNHWSTLFLVHCTSLFHADILF